ncbi:MAG: trypsin-like serine protease [Pseudobdellovibrio sp.]
MKHNRLDSLLKQVCVTGFSLLLSVYTLLIIDTEKAYANTATDSATFEMFFGAGYNVQNVVLNSKTATKNDKVSQFTLALDIYDNVKNKKITTCTGILVSHDLVLTAGHCAIYKNMSIHVKFGLGGKHGFQKIIKTNFYDYLSVAEDNRVDGVEPRWKGTQYLSYDQKMYADLVSRINQRTDLRNRYQGQPHVELIKMLTDIALIKLTEPIPAGYKPVKFYTGPVKFKMPIISAGFGYNSRELSKNTTELRWNVQYIIGHYTAPSEKTLGYESYTLNPNQGMCAGDSGGPHLVWNDGEFQLIGVHAYDTINCAGYKWMVSPLYYEGFFKNAVNKFKRILVNRYY